MERLEPARKLLRFDEFLVDAEARVLLRDGEPVPLTPKVFAVLLALLEKPGQVVSKDELLRKVWPDSAVTEANLTQSISTLRKSLGERAHDRRYVVTVPGQGYSFAGRLAQEAPVPSIPEREPAPPPPPAPSARRPWRLELLSAALILVTLAAWLVLLRSPRKPEEAPVSGARANRLAVAVLGFRNLSGRREDQWLATALPEMLTTELATAKEVRVIPGDNVARARLAEMDAGLGQGTLERAHEVLGADLIVTGSYLELGAKSGDRLRLDLRVLRVPSGEPVASLAEVGSRPELFELVARTGARLRELLGVSGPPPRQARATRALIPANPEAAQLYAEGLARLRSFDASGASVLLKRAAEADPGSAVIRSTLAQAWRDLGHDGRALEDARQAVELARTLPRTERLAIEARLYAISREWDKASEVYRSLWTFYPDDLESGLQLADALTRAGRGAEAQEVVAELRQLPEPMRDDPRIDLAEAATAQLFADTETQTRSARAAAEKGRRARADLIVAQALLHEGEALMRTGHPDQALPLFSQAGARFENAGDRMDLARALTRSGVALHGQGSLNAAEVQYRRALGLGEGIGSASIAAIERGNLGLLYQDRGELRRARASLELSRSLHDQTGDRVREARALTALVEVLWAQGELSQARVELERVQELVQASGNRRDQAKALIVLGMTLADQGKLAEARQRQEQAFELVRGRGDPALAASALAGSASILMRQGDLATARRQLDQALATKRKAGDRIGVTEVLDTRVELALAEGNLAAAGRFVDEQIQTARELGTRGLEARGLGGRAAIQRAGGDLAAARRSLDEALRTSIDLDEQMLAVSLRLDLASLALAQGRPDEAERLADQAASWYASKDLPGREGEALALLAEALASQRRSGEARDAAARARVRLAGSEDLRLRETARRLDENLGRPPR